MSVSIGWSAVEAGRVIEGLHIISKKTEITNEDIKKVMAEHGDFLGDWFILLECEYWDDYNPYYNFFNAMDRLLGIDEDNKEDWGKTSHDFWLKNRTHGRDEGSEPYYDEEGDNE